MEKNARIVVNLQSKSIETISSDRPLPANSIFLSSFCQILKPSFSKIFEFHKLIQFDLNVERISLNIEVDPLLYMGPVNYGDQSQLRQLIDTLQICKKNMTPEQISHIEQLEHFYEFKSLFLPEANILKKIELIYRYYESYFFWFIKKPSHKINEDTIHKDLGKADPWTLLIIFTNPYFYFYDNNFRANKDELWVVNSLVAIYDELVTSAGNLGSLFNIYEVAGAVTRARKKPNYYTSAKYSLLGISDMGRLFWEEQFDEKRTFSTMILKVFFDGNFLWKIIDYCNKCEQ